MITNEWSIEFTSCERQINFFMTPQAPQMSVVGLFVQKIHWKNLHLLDPNRQISKFFFWASVSHGGAAIQGNPRQHLYIT